MLFWIILCIVLGVLLGWFGRPWVTGELKTIESQAAALEFWKKQAKTVAGSTAAKPASK